MKATIKLAWVRAFRPKRGLPGAERTSLMRVGLVAALGALIMMFWATNVESTIGTARYFQTNTYDTMLLQRGVDNPMLSSAVPASIVDELQATPGLKAVGVTWYFANVSGRDVLVGMYRSGGSTAPLLAEGHDVLSDDEVVLDKGLARSLGVQVGDNLTLANHRYQVVGLSRETGAFGKEMVFISESAMFRLYGGEFYNSVAITGVVPPRLRAELAGNYDLITRQQYIDGNVDYWVRNVSGLIVTIIGVITLGGAILVTIILGKQLELQLPTLGMMRAVGASRGQIVGSEVIALAWLSVCGLILALPLATALIALTNLSTPGFHASLTADAASVGVVGIALITIISSLRLARKASRANVMALIRS